MIDLNPTELYAANQIINAGLMKAADSLSFFMKEKISFVAQTGSEVLRHSAVQLSEKQGASMLLLITEVVGEMKGLCCLIFTEEEADQLRSAALPEEIRKNPEMMKEMSDAIMLEVDNIISAAVVTQFSNILKKEMHGGVPRLLKLDFSQLAEFVNDELQRSRYIIRFKTNFTSSGIHFNPEFLWLFDQQFVESIRTFAAAGENIEKLKAWNVLRKV